MAEARAQGQMIPVEIKGATEGPAQESEGVYSKNAAQTIQWGSHWYEKK